MINELRTYTLTPGSIPAYVKLAGEVGRKVRGDRYGKLEGYWTTEFGTLNQVMHLWSYADLAERDRLRAELARNEEWARGYIPQSRPYLVAQENKILAPQVPLKPPAEAGHVYELRTYRTQPGKAPEWIRLFQGILPTREKYSRNVGLWMTEMGQLNEVVHLWAYRDLVQRAEVRAQVTQDPEWQKFLAAATPLLVEMRSVVLSPAAHSPMR